MSVASSFSVADIGVVNEWYQLPNESSFLRISTLAFPLQPIDGVNMCACTSTYIALRSICKKFNVAIYARAICNAHFMPALSDIVICKAWNDDELMTNFTMLRSHLQQTKSCHNY